MNEIFAAISGLAALSPCFPLASFTVVRYLREPVAAGRL